MLNNGFQTIPQQSKTMTILGTIKFRKYASLLRHMPLHQLRHYDGSSPNHNRNVWQPSAVCGSPNLVRGYGM